MNEYKYEIPCCLETSRSPTDAMNNSERIRFFLKNAILMLIWSSESLASSSDISSSMKAVKDRILNGYDKTIRPTTKGSNTTFVAIGLIPRQILDVDEERGLFVLDSYLSIAWEDPRLKWNAATEYEGVLQLPADLLWVPNIFVHDSHSVQINPTGEALLSVFSEGIVTWTPALHTQTSCPSVFQATSEVVTCDVKVGSWIHDGWAIGVIRDEHVFLGKFLNINARWELLVSQTKVISKKTGHAHKNRSDLNMVFPMKRRTPPEVEATKTPCILAMILNLSIFWLPPNSSKKVLLGGILFLVLTQMLLYVVWSTKYPLSVLWAVPFLQSAMYLVVITLLFQLLVIFNLCNIAGPLRPPSGIMRLLKVPFGKYIYFGSSLDVNDNIPIDVIQLHEDGMNSTKRSTPRDDWMLFAAGLDRLFFLLMATVMIALHS